MDFCTQSMLPSWSLVTSSQSCPATKYRPTCALFPLTASRFNKLTYLSTDTVMRLLGAVLISFLNFFVFFFFFAHFKRIVPYYISVLHCLCRFIQAFEKFITTEVPLNMCCWGWKVTRSKSVTITFGVYDLLTWICISREYKSSCITLSFPTCIDHSALDVCM